MAQSFLTGQLNGWSYRGLLEARLTSEQFSLGTIVQPTTLTIPVPAIVMVKQIRNLLEFGIKIKYRHNDRERVVGFRTRRYRAWGHAFQHLGIRVEPPTGWLHDFDWPPLELLDTE